MNDARKDCPFVLTAFTGWSSERCPGIGFLSRGDREIGIVEVFTDLTVWMGIRKIIEQVNANAVAA